MFSAMMEGIKEESVGSLFNLQVQRQDSPIVEEAAAGGIAGGAAAGPAPGGAVLGGPAAAQPAAPARPGRHSRTGPGAKSAAPARSGTPGPVRRAGPVRGPGERRPRPPRPNGGQAVPAGLTARGLDRPQRRGGLQYSAPSDDASGQAEQRDAPAGRGDYAKVGRNAPCPCGSGRKYKLCHGDPRNR